MLQTSPYKVAPTAPVHVPLEGFTHPAIHFGRNTSLASLGKEFNKD